MTNKLTPEEERKYSRLAESMEKDQYHLSVSEASAINPVEYNAELDEIVSELDPVEDDSPTPAAPDDSVTPDQLDEFLHGK